MKIRTMIPAVIALFVLVGGPFGLGTPGDSDPRGGLVCYCCAADENSCTMISCSGPCCAHPGPVADRSSSEMIPESFPTIIPVKFAYSDREVIRLPETVYLEVPDKPPQQT